ncbi:uncharacterized protein [Kogia breviceps]|uniref:uncharacterized protein n=1 Tax=Kogia breviceps TaxID=27615 RepID=UPI0034D2D1DF
MAEGLCSRGHDSAAPAASGRVPPARAERPCLDWVHSRFLRPDVAGPRAPPRKYTPVVAFRRRSRTTRPGGWSLPCVWVVRQPGRSTFLQPRLLPLGEGLTPSYRPPWSLADIWSLDDCATLSPAKPTGGLALGPSTGGRPTPGLGVGARPLLLNAQRTVTGHRTAQAGRGLKEPWSAAACLDGRGALGPVSRCTVRTRRPFSPALRCDPNTQAAAIDLRCTRVSLAWNGKAE